MIIAAYNGRKKKLEFLLSKGADVNLAGKKGWTPLMAACWTGLSAVVERYEGYSAKYKLLTLSFVSQALQGAGDRSQLPR